MTKKHQLVSARSMLAFIEGYFGGPKGYHTRQKEDDLEKIPLILRLSSESLCPWRAGARKFSLDLYNQRYKRDPASIYLNRRCRFVETADRSSLLRLLSVLVAGQASRPVPASRVTVSSIGSRKSQAYKISGSGD